MTKKKKIAFLLVSLWLSGVIIAFWFFEIRTQLVFDEYDRFSEYRNIKQRKDLAEKIMTLAEIENQLNGVQIVHFHKPRCRCNKIPQAHIRKLNTSKTKRDYSTALVTTNEADLKEIKSTYNADTIIQTEIFSTLSWLPSLPAVAILHQGKIASIGPYSSGFVCGPSNSYVELVLKLIRQKKAPQLFNGMELGCYCKNI